MDPCERALWVELARAGLAFRDAEELVRRSRDCGLRGAVTMHLAPHVELTVNLDAIASRVALAAVGTASQKGD